MDHSVAKPLRFAMLLRDHVLDPRLIPIHDRDEVCMDIMYNPTANLDKSLLP